MINRMKDPVSMQLDTSGMDMEKLQPHFYRLRNGKNVAAFASDTSDLVKIDFVFEAGFAYQSKKLSANIANRLLTEGTTKHTAKEIANFLDYRGIFIEKYLDTTTSTFSVIMLKKYVKEVLPLLHELITLPSFSEQEFRIALQKLKQQFLNDIQKTNYLARKLFLQSIFGKTHEYAAFASIKDFDNLTLNDVQTFLEKYYRLENCTIFICGNVDDEILDTINKYFGQNKATISFNKYSPKPVFRAPKHKFVQKSDAIQSSIRIGKVIDIDWKSYEYAELMIVNALLGGYFGSRLMSNLREDKGYCYGIYSMTQIIRNMIVFSITAEVRSEVTKQALQEIYRELELLQREPVSETELNMLKGYLIGEFMRSIDGFFELMDRYKHIVNTCITEELTKNYLLAIDSIVPKDICKIAKKYLQIETMTQAVVASEKVD